MFDQRKIMELQKLAGGENFRKLTIPQMLEREKLIKLIEESGMLNDQNRCSIVADELIANGVAIPVRCKDCKQYNGHRYCYYFAQTVLDNDFCSYGERRGND